MVDIHIDSTIDNGNVNGVFDNHFRTHNLVINGEEYVWSTPFFLFPPLLTVQFKKDFLFLIILSIFLLYLWVFFYDGFDVLR